ncbi:tRNA lysidine(34) synthetase TilS [Galbibacter pacificus]|uniref:tRNA(Ile)-lysidine synthase n=1 Tax=Galbibacter pacificus TaxID=2996052 RepID=A0ABT6FQ21_9FLAO|nr:tRNA lysidine(34) synthetase TilS [Galbibacter pacificus]MDG3582162.1 tRNA lysidine(34) synthetase TilS [Galbibacter pacificus]MDG3585362.1 tRNA lysidine(34) synthetase TilS [Galbibacter pacificus]
MLEKFHHHINGHLSFLSSSRIAVAVSGGIDSMVLLYLFHQLKMDVCVLHCNFQLRGAVSDADEQFIQKQAKKYGIPFYSVRFDTNAYVEKYKTSTQIAARDLRYKWFEEQKDVLNFDYLCTAHHADDSLETFLINLSRGTGLQGLTGIPEVNNYIVRPLLLFSREEIQEFAIHNNILWREDSSNAETKYLRNKLRHDIIPKLKEINPALLNNFKRTVENLKGDAKLIENNIVKLRSDIFIEENDKIIIEIDKLKSLSPRLTYLFYLFADYGFTEPNEIEDILQSQSGKQLLSETHRLVKDRDSIIITPVDFQNKEEIYCIYEENSRLTTPINLSIDLVDHINTSNPCTVYVDKEKLKFPLKLRKWKNGDYFYPFGMQGKKKISKYFKDEKFSLPDKEQQWLLCNNNNEIIWVIGHRADNRYKVTEKTKQIIKIESVDA